MAIFYTTYEGGKINPLPVKSSHANIVKQLYKNRQVVKVARQGSEVGDCFTHLKLTDVRYPYRIHSVFFLKGIKITKIWDASLNGYRQNKYTKGTTLKLKNQTI